MTSWDEKLSIEERLHLGITTEWWSPGVLKPSMAIEYAEVTAWRSDQVARGARVMTQDEWRKAHER